MLIMQPQSRHPRCTGRSDAYILELRVHRYAAAARASAALDTSQGCFSTSVIVALLLDPFETRQTFASVALMASMRVLIIGAGCTGLLVAQGLRNHGINATVFERSSINRRPRDWTMMVHWGADYIRELLPDDVFERLRDAVTDPWIEVEPGKHDERPVWNGKTGEVYVWIKSVVFRRYSRKRLCRILSEGVDVRYEKDLVDIRTKEAGGVQAIFADGSIEEGDVLLGADSANSRVRSWLFDDDPSAKCSDLPMIVYNFPAKYSDAALARRIRDHPHPLMKVSTHPDHRTWYIIAPLEVPDLDKPEDWTFQHFLTQWTEDAIPGRDAAERLAHFKSIGATYAEPFRSATSEVDDSTFVPHDRLKYWAEPKLWDNRQGRVTLAGDAAHPFPPHRAQGLNNGIQDAANFVKAIKDALDARREGDFAAALRAYDDEVFERGAKEIATSVKQAYDATRMSEFASSTVVTHGHRPLPKEMVPVQNRGSEGKASMWNGSNHSPMHNAR